MLQMPVLIIKSVRKGGVHLQKRRMKRGEDENYLIWTILKRLASQVVPVHNTV